MFSSDVGLVTMTTDMQALKTNEFLRRRKLRLQQVREQSKDIAKKVRQRAKVEKQRHIGDLDVRKEKEYLVRQEKLVRQLEELYAKGVQNVGSSHKSASNLQKDQENIPPNIDLAKVRAREAASVLRYEKEQNLLKHKTLLARKAQAREAANEISREKLKTSTKLLESKTINTDEATNKNNPKAPEDKVQSEAVEPSSVTSKVDMGTQFNFKELPREWAPSLPILTVTNEDTEPNNDSGNSNQLIAPPNTRRTDLFAVSEEMPNSLRNSSANRLSDNIMTKPSFSLVSEYLQTRNLRLREPDINQPKVKKTPEDFQSLKQTIQRTRSAKEAKGVKATGDPDKTNIPEDLANRRTENAATKKSSVTVYNHSTRDTRAMLFPSDTHVSRDQHQPDDDAYSQAIRESMTDERDREHEKKLNDMRSKIAMSKQSVEKEYKDTMSFLNSMPKEIRTGRPVKQAFMDDKRQQMVKEDRQRRMNHDFAEIEKECRRRSSMTTKPRRPRSKSADRNADLTDEDKDFQYSWMPVPDNDEAMAVHTIPVTLKEGKNCVKFSKVDSYHEYRSRHKHTPPTKESTRVDDSKGVETMVADMQEVTDSSDSSDSSLQSVAIQTKHIKHKTRKQTKKQSNKTNKQDISDTEKIIVYKIIESKEKARKKSESQVSLFSGDDKGRGDAERSANGDNERKTTTAQTFTTEKHYGDMYNSTRDQTGSVASTSVAVDVNNSHTVNSRTTRECFCGNTRKGNSDKSLPLYQWERSDGATTHIERNATENSPSESKKEIQQPQTTATSSSSFKTAAQVQNGQAVQDGLMKFVDEAGKETGNFYIGTSGYLKDKDYEVIIKLRKKDTNEEILPDRAQSRAEIIESRKEPISSDDRLTVIGNKSVSSNPTMPLEATETKSVREHNESNTDYIQKTAESQKILQANVTTPNPVETISTNADGAQSSEAKQEQSNAALRQGHSTPGDSNPKILTSACTQTTLLSPVRPPILQFHLSSSTSTSYMSPPEMIYPTFFESFPSEYLHQDRHKHEHHRHSCNCKKHKRSKKGSADSDDPERKSSSDVRSKKCCKKHKHAQKQSKLNVKITSKLSDEEPCRCRKCVSAKPSKTYALMKRYSRKYMYSKSKDLKRGNKSAKLNPALKSYVNKLLELNREGMRVIDVVDQDCSEVTTPASSVVNVDSNVEADKSLPNNRITLNRISEALLKNMARHHETKQNLSLGKHMGHITTENELEKLFLEHFPRLMRRRSSVHKIRTLNISKKLISISSTNESHDDMQPSPLGTSNSKPKSPHITSQISSRRQSSPTPRYTIVVDNADTHDQVVNFKNIDSLELAKQINDIKSAVKDINIEKVTKGINNIENKKRDVASDANIKIEVRSQAENKKIQEIKQYSTLTQTDDLSSNKTSHSENKVQNMKYIAQLTDKCTKRLSDLAKVLSEVRKNKSLAYSHISTEPSSDSQPRLEKSTTDKSAAEQIRSNHEHVESEAQPGSSSPSEEDVFVKSTDYMFVLEGIPKPTSPLLSSPTKSSKSSGDESNLSRDQIIKLKNRPPTALSRINLKRGEEYIVPHELSTVLEVDSPMSIRVKNENNSTKNSDMKDSLFNPDTRGKSVAGASSTTATTKLGSLGKSKMELMDLKKFNEIMLKPYLSIDDFAKQCHINITEDSQNDGPPKNNSDETSMPSEGSLPDVIEELLKRNVISEPFKFDTASNVNSTTISSESSVSVFALSKVHCEKNKSNLLFHQKGNDVAETSDTLSVSSNPDFEIVINKLGMGWASSTLKKTKESQALSTSSNTSSSSQHRNVKPNTMPKASRETASSVSSPKSKRCKPPKSVQQQTSITNSMTVKEFLTNELSKQITFSNKSIRRNDTEELVSLYETNMNGEPHTPTNNRTVESDKNTNRARTSTPVQIYKSPTYKSSSSSNTNNTSNGLFGNVDELSSVKLTSGSFKNNSTSDKDDLTIPNCSLKLKRNSDLSKSD